MAESANSRRLRRQYTRKVNKLVRDIRRQERSGVRQAMRILRDTRERVLGDLDTARGFEAFHADEIRQAVDRSVEEFEDRYGHLAKTKVDDAFKAGQAMVKEPLETVTELTFSIPELPADLVEVLQGTTADLVKEVGQRMRDQINGEVQQAVTGAQRPVDARRSIENMFRTGRSQLRGFRQRTGFAWQAERIVGTEVNRVFSVSNVAALEQAQASVPDMKGQWITTRDGRERDSHIRNHLKVREKGETFPNGLRYPLDPSGPPEEVVNCRCVLVAFREEWDLSLPESTRAKKGRPSPQKPAGIAI